MVRISFLFHEKYLCLFLWLKFIFKPFSFSHQMPWNQAKTCLVMHSEFQDFFIHTFVKYLYIFNVILMILKFKWMWINFTKFPVRYKSRNLIIIALKAFFYLSIYKSNLIVQQEADCCWNKEVKNNQVLHVFLILFSFEPEH